MMLEIVLELDGRNMFETLDQIFVTLKHQAVGFVPDAWQPLVSALISVALIPLVFATLFAFVTVFERKGIGRIQNRYGPNRVGIPLTKIDRKSTRLNSSHLGIS